MFRIAAIFLILSASANAADPWTRTDTAYEIAYQVADYMDWRQTREFTQASYYTLGNYELNPIMGKHPSHTTVNETFLIGSIGHYAISRMLPAKARHIWQYVTIGFESGVVGHNYQIGIRAKF